MLLLWCKTGLSFIDLEEVGFCWLSRQHECGGNRYTNLGFPFGAFFLFLLLTTSTAAVTAVIVIITTTAITTAIAVAVALS